MVLSCPSANCPLCIGPANQGSCNACKVARRDGRTPIGKCHHDSIERHMAMPALEDPAQSRVPTKPMPPLAKQVLASLLMTIADPDALAAYLREVADIIERNGRLKVTVE